MKQIIGILTFVATLLAMAEGPNVLWITAEDMSPVLGCYGDQDAITPHLDKFARESVRYDNAFATAPVCSPSRSCLINGLPATSQGTHNMRSAFPIPELMRGFPARLRQAGYYTTNNVKTDYNSANFETIIRSSWDTSSATAHWRQRPAGKPFFSVFNLMTSHQSRAMVWPYERFVKEVQSKLSANEIHDPSRIGLPSYYPDTPVIRRTVARFYDCVTAMDKEVGAILQQLEDDGLAEDTIVFFYSDHGTGLPRHKRALLDSGMRVALMVRFPAKWQSLAPSAAGTATDRLVNFADFAPTVLSLTGQKIPDYVEGTSFLGKQTGPARTYVYGHRDRVDEVIDLARSVRDKRYLYLRTYMPHLGYNQPTAWPDLGEIRHEFYKFPLAKMTPAQRHFAAATRPIEELYDCQEDPENLNNLAASPDHAEILVRLRKALEAEVVRTRDLGFLPEAMLTARTKGTTPYEYARKDYDVSTYMKAAAVVGRPQNETTLLRNLSSDDAGVRYWGAVGFSAAETLSEVALRALQGALKDTAPNVRIEAANALARHGHASAAIPILGDALADSDLTVVTYAARIVELLGKKVAELLPDVRNCDARMKVIRPPGTSPVVVQPDKDAAMFIGFSTAAFIKKMEDAVGWQDLFDGKTLAGWEAMAPGQVEVKDGSIAIFAKGKNLWLMHEREFGNFELEAETKMPEVYNSGIGFRCVAKGKGKPVGYQCEIDGRKSGAIYAIGKGWVHPKDGRNGWEPFFAEAGDAYKLEAGAWNHFRILCQGNHIQIWINGVKTTDVKADLFGKGRIALQHHGKGDVHYFRNVRIRELP